jgi:hypothetical protein
MKRLILPTIAAFAVGAGCGLGDDEYQNAPPTSRQVTIPVPGANGKTSASSEGGGHIDSALLGTTSEYYQFTYAVSATVNVVTIALVDLVHHIAEQKPSSSGMNSRTWGPYTPGGLDPLTYRQVVTKLADKHFTFSIEARLKSESSDAAFVALLDGEITKGKDPDTGKGTMTLHFDNRRKLLPDTCEQGTIAFAFDNTQPLAVNDVMFHQFANANPMNKLCKSETPTDAMYHYDQTSDGAGDFVFSFAANIHKDTDNKPLSETVSIRSRWLASGAGRSDFKLSGGEVQTDLMTAGLMQTFVSASQCWDASYQTIYETSAPSQLHLIATAGDPMKCAFTSEMLP